MIRKHTMLIDVAAPLVERASPGQAPTAFRIWAAGENVCDDGSVFFTEESAKLLVAEQTARARVYAIDFDHLSLTANRPAESGRAAGWHSLEVRTNAYGKPELWAVSVEWCADAKAGLEETPPRWRFFSPAFLTNDEGEITSYVNLALCINPLTHDIPSLAARTGDFMKDQLLAALATMASDASDDEKKEAKAKLAEFLEGLDDDKREDKKAEGDDEKQEEKAEEPPPSTDREEKKETAEPPKGTPKEEKPKEEKTEAKSVVANAAAEMASELVDAKRRLEALEIQRLLDARQDLPQSVRNWCLSQPTDVVRTFLSASPRVIAKRNAQPTVGAATTAGLHGAELEEVNRLMGIRPPEAKGPQRMPDGRLVLHTMRPSEYRATKAAAAKGGQ